MSNDCQANHHKANNARVVVEYYTDIYVQNNVNTTMQCINLLGSKSNLRIRLITQ